MHQRRSLAPALLKIGVISVLSRDQLCADHDLQNADIGHAQRGGRQNASRGELIFRPGQERRQPRNISPAGRLPEKGDRFPKLLPIQAFPLSQKDCGRTGEEDH